MGCALGICGSDPWGLEQRSLDSRDFLSLATESLAWLEAPAGQDHVAPDSKTGCSTDLGSGDRSFQPGLAQPFCYSSSHGGWKTRANASQLEARTRLMRDRERFGQGVCEGGRGSGKEGEGIISLACFLGVPMSGKPY